MYTNSRAALSGYGGILDILAAPFKAAYSVGKAAVNIAPDVLQRLQESQAYREQQAQMLPGLPSLPGVPTVASPPFVAPGMTSGGVTFGQSSGVSPVLVLGALGLGAYVLTRPGRRRR